MVNLTVMIMNIMIMMFYAMGKAGLHIKEQAENNKDLEEVLFQHGHIVYRWIIILQTQLKKIDLIFDQSHLK